MGGPPPYVPGFDVSGVVESVGADCKRLRVGDRVWAMNVPTIMGTFAELAVLPEACVDAKPANLTFAEAASVPLAALTSMQALRTAALGAGAAGVRLTGGRLTGGRLTGAVRSAHGPRAGAGRQRRHGRVRRAVGRLQDRGQGLGRRHVQARARCVTTMAP